MNFQIGTTSYLRVFLSEQGYTVFWKVDATGTRYFGMVKQIPPRMKSCVGSPEFTPPSDMVECAESTTWHGRIHRITRLLVVCCVEQLCGRLHVTRTRRIKYLSCDDVARARTANVPSLRVSEFFGPFSFVTTS
jgi:hypothetical protein